MLTVVEVWAERLKTNQVSAYPFPLENAAIIMTKNGEDIQGSRVKGPVSPTTRSKGLQQNFLSRWTSYLIKFSYES